MLWIYVITPIKNAEIVVFKVFHPPKEGIAQNGRKKWILWKKSVKWHQILFDWSMFVVAGTCRRVASLAFFKLKNWCYAQKYLKMVSKWKNGFFYKSFGRVPSYVGAKFGKTMRSHKINKNDIFFTSKMGLRQQVPQNGLKLK